MNDINEGWMKRNIVYPAHPIAGPIPPEVTQKEFEAVREKHRRDIARLFDVPMEVLEHPSTIEVLRELGKMANEDKDDRHPRDVIADIRAAMKEANTTTVHADFINRDTMVREVWLCKQPDSYYVVRDEWMEPYNHAEYNTLRVVFEAQDANYIHQSISPMKTATTGENIPTQPCNLYPGKGDHDPHVYLQTRADKKGNDLFWCDGTGFEAPVCQGAGMQPGEDSVKLLSVDPTIHKEDATDTLAVPDYLSLMEKRDPAREARRADRARVDGAKPEPKMTRVVYGSVREQPCVEMWWCEPPTSELYTVDSDRWSTAHQHVNGEDKIVHIHHIDAITSVYLPADDLAKVTQPDPTVEKTGDADLPTGTTTVRVMQPYMTPAERALLAEKTLFAEQLGGGSAMTKDFEQATALIRETAYDRRLTSHGGIAAQDAFRKVVLDAAQRLTSKYTNTNNIDTTNKAVEWVVRWWTHPDDITEDLNDEVYRNHEGSALYLADITEQIIRVFYEALIPGWHQHFQADQAQPYEDEEEDEEIDEP